MKDYDTLNISDYEIVYEPIIQIILAYIQIYMNIVFLKNKD